MQYFFIFILGIIVGSFLNFCIRRLPPGGPADGHCRVCGASPGIAELLPVIGYLLLRGRCRACGASVSVRKTVVEILTGALFVWCLVSLGPGPALVKALIFTAFLVVITFIDLDHQLILDKVLIWMAVVGVALNLIFAYWLPGAFPRGLALGPLGMFGGGLLGGVVMLVIALVSRGGMGGGDIKFAAVIGLWAGWQLTLLALLISFLIGGVSGGVLVMLKIKGRKDFIPFGPFIAAGAFIALLHGVRILSWYLHRYTGQ